MSKAPAQSRPLSLGIPSELPGMSKRDYFMFLLGYTVAQAVREPLDELRFTLAAPDEETRLLGEVALELLIKTVAPSPAAVRLREHVNIIVGKPKQTRIETAAARTVLPVNPKKLH